MKKNVLALSIAAMVGGFAGVAQADVLVPAGVASGTVLGTVVSNEINPAVPAAAPAATVLEVNTNNVGHMLVVPYYTAQNGNMTVLHLSNTDRSNGKAVKIRFRGAANSDDVKDFQVFLSPGDIWTAAVLEGADGAATLFTADNSCTVPAIPATGTAFSTARLNAADNVNGTREGYVEIFNMADIPSVRAYATTVGASGDPAGVAGTAHSILYSAIKHSAAGVAPCSVAGSAARTLLDDIAMDNKIDAEAAASVGFGGSTTGLSADWYIMNVPQTTTFSGTATAVEARDANGVAGFANFVHFPQTDQGSGAFFVGTAIDQRTADPLLRTDAKAHDGTLRTSSLVTPLFIDLPDMSTPYIGALGANAAKLQAVRLTDVLSRTSVANQYALDESITALTDWTFSMPTRRYSVAANYTVPTTNVAYRLYSDLSVVGANAAGAMADDEWFSPSNTRVDARGNICVDADGMRFFNREEVTTGAAPIFSPAVAGQLSFCGETSVLSFSAGKVLGSSSALTATTMNTPYVNGWTVVNTANAFTGAGNTLPAVIGLQGGLPVVGASFIKMTNPSAGAGFSGTYGVTWGHRLGR